MIYKKLVRDKIPEIIKKQSKEPITHIANEEEYWDKLKLKLKEETEEFCQNNTKEELADILEVIDSIKDFQKINEQELTLLKEKKFNERGGFKNKIILDEVKD